MAITLLSIDALEHDESYAHEEWKLIQIRMQMEDNPENFFKPYRLNDIDMRDDKLPAVFKNYVAREYNIEEIKNMVTSELPLKQ